jgi:hypothetical protein
VFAATFHVFRASVVNPLFSVCSVPPW